MPHLERNTATSTSAVVDRSVAAHEMKGGAIHGSPLLLFVAVLFGGPIGRTFDLFYRATVRP